MNRPTPPTPDTDAPAAATPATEASRRPTAGDWLDLRLSWRGFVYENLDEPMPAGVGWWQTLGNLLMTFLAFQFVTGVVLAMYYAPTPDHAHQSVGVITNGIALGSVVRGIHHWGATLIVIVTALHLMRVFFWGSYKMPRELTWLVGVAILQVILGFSFTGYLLPWDQKAYWATVVGTRIAGTVPFVGEKVLQLMRGGPEVGALTLTRFYAVHIMALPIALVALAGLHLFLVRKHHIAGPVIPQKGEPVPFWPVQLFKDAVVAIVGIGLLMALAVLARPELGDVADPSRVDFSPRPEWYFLGLFELLKVIPPKLEVVGTLVVPGVGMTALALLPWLDRSRSRHPVHRRLVIELALVVIVGLGLLTLKGVLEEPPPRPKAVAHAAQHAPAPSPQP